MNWTETEGLKNYVQVKMETKIRKEGGSKAGHRLCKLFLVSGEKKSTIPPNTTDSAEQLSAPGGEAVLTWRRLINASGYSRR